MYYIKIHARGCYRSSLPRRCAPDVVAPGGADWIIVFKGAAGARRAAIRAGHVADQIRAGAFGALHSVQISTSMPCGIPLIRLKNG